MLLYYVIKIFLQNLTSFDSVGKLRQFSCSPQENNFLTYVTKSTEQDIWKALKCSHFLVSMLLHVVGIHRKLCLLLPILLVEMSNKHRMCFCCARFLFYATMLQSCKKILCLKIYSRRID